MADIADHVESTGEVRAAAVKLEVSGTLGIPLVQRDATEGAGADEEDPMPTGIMLLFRKERRAFSPVHVELAQTFADQAAIAIANLTLIGEVREKTREVAQLKIEIDEARVEEGRAREQIAKAPEGQEADVRVWQEDDSPYQRMAQGLRDRGVAGTACRAPRPRRYPRR